MLLLSALFLTACGGGGGGRVNPGGGITGSWPNAANTGVPSGTSLTASGSISVTTDDTVIEWMGKISGPVQFHLTRVLKIPGLTASVAASTVPIPLA
jgi:hypothetical protein